MIADEHYTPSTEQIDAVLGFLSTLEQENFVPSGVKAPPGQFPYHIFAEELSQFQRALYDNGFVSSFDWPSWQEEALRYYEQPELLRTADMRVLRQLITFHVRKERFFEGHLPGMVECGHITAILRKPKELRDASFVLSKGSGRAAEPERSAFLDVPDKPQNQQEVTMVQITPKIPTILAGVAGEYFVAAELSRRGWIASISLRNTRGIDILVTNQEASRSVTIQCKTNQKKGKQWMLSEKSETFSPQDHFYVFVGLGEFAERPNYHIVPSKVVAEHVQKFHRLWLDTPGHAGQQHVDNSIRKFSDTENEFLERWEFLGL